MIRYEIVLKSPAIKDIDSIKKYYSTTILDSIETHLRYKPDMISKSRIKKLKGIQDADYRLRVDDYRIFYNIDKQKQTVYILRVLHKETHKFYK